MILKITSVDIRDDRIEKESTLFYSLDIRIFLDSFKIRLKFDQIFLEQLILLQETKLVFHKFNLLTLDH